VTSGGDRLRRWTPAAITVALLSVAVVGNLASTLAGQTRAGRALDLFAPLLDEFSSALAWLVLVPPIVRAFKTLVPPRFPWALALPLHVAGAALASLVHYGLTRILRTLVHAAMGQGLSLPLSWDGYLADLYKDVLTYLLLGLVYWGAEALLAARNRTPATAQATVLEVRDGAQTTYVQIADILWVEAAGNYVELHLARQRTLLMRTTLASLQQRLESTGFLRIHRSRLVNTAVVASIENQPVGDATLSLNDGTTISASRRYRPTLALAMVKRTTGPAA
jgi:hypothetical protein